MSVEVAASSRFRREVENVTNDSGSSIFSRFTPRVPLSVHHCVKGTGSNIPDCNITGSAASTNLSLPRLLRIQTLREDKLNPMIQKALIVRTGADGHEGLKELNLELERGWRVASVCPMGGAGDAGDAPCHAALVVLERRDNGTTVAVEALERAEKEASSVVEDVMRDVGGVVEGNGAGPPNEPTP